MYLCVRMQHVSEIDTLKLHQMEEKQSKREYNVRTWALLNEHVYVGR